MPGKSLFDEEMKRGTCQTTSLRVVPVLFLSLAALPSYSQELTPVVPRPGNVQNYHTAPEEGAFQSSDIPTPESYLKQKAIGQDEHHQKMVQLLAAKDYAGFKVEFEKKPEAGWAEALAWIYRGEGKTEEAKTWFLRALSLDPSDISAAHGLALNSKRRETSGHPNETLGEAEAQARREPNNLQMRNMLQQIYTTEASKSYDQLQYDQCLYFLARAATLDPLTEDQLSLRAWTNYKLGNYGVAALEFESLYRVRHDRSSAEGLFYSLQRMDCEDRARALAQELGGPLRTLVGEQLAHDDYNRSLFQAAEVQEPGLYPALKNIDSASLDLGGSLRQKSGQSGLSSLQEERLPFAGGSIDFDGLNQLVVQSSRLNLDSGPLALNSAVGSFPVKPRAYSYAPTTYLGDLAQVNMSFVHQGWFTPYLELGTTPIGGPVSVLPTGRLGFIQQVSSGNWGLSLYGKSNTESILSYTGIHDPYSRGSWGRVIESGIEASGYTDLGCNWGFSGDGTLGVLTGDRVETNESAVLDVGVGKDLRLDGFQYFVVGPSFFGETFEHNLSGFTIGQGGYFSPAYLAEAMIGVNFLTLEGQPYIVRARFGFGGQDNRQDESPLFPRSPDGRNYRSLNQASYVASGEIEGVVRLSDHWQFGGSVSYDKSADYTESKEMLFFRFLFEPRPDVFSSDLLKNWP